MDTSGISTRLGRTIQTLLEVRHEIEGHFLGGTVILRFLAIFKKSQISSTFETLNSASLSMCQTNMTPLLEMRWRPWAFCRVSTVDSDSISSCDMNDEPALSLCREICPSFESGHLGVHFTCSRKHRVPLTYIFLRENSSWSACGKLAYLFSRIQGISSHPQMT